MDNDSMTWYHAHVYFKSDQQGLDNAAKLHARMLSAEYDFEYVGDLEVTIVGPHPLPQFEAHFKAPALWDIVPRLYVDRIGLSVLVHPVSPNDHEDHFDDAIWLGEPLGLDATKLDPPGLNQAFARLGQQSKIKAPI